MKWSCLLGVACLYMGGTFAAVPVDDPVLGPTERKVVLAGDAAIFGDRRSA